MQRTPDRYELHAGSPSRGLVSCKTRPHTARAVLAHRQGDMLDQDDPLDQAAVARAQPPSRLPADVGSRHSEVAGAPRRAPPNVPYDRINSRILLLPSTSSTFRLSSSITDYTSHTSCRCSSPQDGSSSVRDQYSSISSSILMTELRT
jgi:hypothetical protein